MTKSTTTTIALAYEDACGCGWDSEEDRYMFYSEDFDEWRARLPEVRPFEINGGEVAEYRLELTLNELGRAFLMVSS